jgi:hypothetical protein
MKKNQILANWRVNMGCLAKSYPVGGMAYPLAQHAHQRTAYYLRIKKKRFFYGLSI